LILGSTGLNPHLSLYLGSRKAILAQQHKGILPAEPADRLIKRWNGRKCILRSNVDVGKEFSIQPCTLGNFNESQRRLLVFGNSFSATLLHAFNELINDDGFAVTITSSYGSMPVPGIKRLKSQQYNRSNDYYWQQIFPPMVAQLRPGDWVFLASDVAGFSPEKSDPESDLMMAKLEKELKKLSDELAARDIHLAFLHGNPFARESGCEPVIAARQWFHFGGQPCSFLSRRQSLARRARLDRLLRSLEAQGRLRIIDLFDLFCPGTICTYESADGVVLYRDSHSHPSVDAARLSAPWIRTILLGKPVPSKG
jgi:hypothetical protein